MCVAAIAWRAHPRWVLVAAANRDEYHARPAAPLAKWPNGIIAGQDLEAGGTWLGVHEAGRFALVTNRRAEGWPRAGMASRGGLVSGWLLGEEPHGIEAMNPFSALLADTRAARLLTNFPEASARALAPGLHSLSNGGIDEAAWFKSLRLEAALGQWLEADTEPAALLAPLADRTPNPAEPGNPLSAVFSLGPVYGTRCSSVVAIDPAGRGAFIERRYDATGAIAGETALGFEWPG